MRNKESCEGFVHSIPPTGNVGKSILTKSILTQNSPQRERLKSLLSALGYAYPESRIRIRCFAPKNMPLSEQLRRGIAWQKDEETIIPIPVEGWFYPSTGVFVQLKKSRRSDNASSKTTWIEAKTYQDGIAYLNQINAKGYGIYFIPNEGGGADSDIVRFPALFYECDGVSKAKQWQRLKSLEAELGRPASTVIETRNSLHCYFLLTYDCLLASTWKKYQLRLIQKQDSDPAIHNPARVMRLAGFDHQRWNTETNELEQFPVTLVQQNDNVFALDEFDRVLPEQIPTVQQEKARREASETVASDPNSNPWDIRNFAHYLDGYQQDGRHGWDTAKCPAHNGTSDNSLHIEQNSGAFKCHAGCDKKEVYHAALDLAKSHGYQLPQRNNVGYFFGGLIGGLAHRLKKQFEKLRKSPYGFSRKSEVEVEVEPEKTSPAIEFNAGERLETYSEAKKREYKYVLDISGTGTAKSYDAGLATPSMFGLNRIIYVSAEYRNASTPTLARHPGLESRHNSLYRDEFGKLRRVNEKRQPYVVPPNCGRTDTLNALRNKNIPGADTAELICKTCPHFEPCRGGATYDYLNQRAKKLKEEKWLRMHQNSLPSFVNDNLDLEDPVHYPDIGLIWDEASQILTYHKSTEVEASDLDRVIADLTLKLPNEFEKLRLLLTTLKQLLNKEIKQPDRYGFKDRELRKLLVIPDEINIDLIKEALQPDLNNLLNDTQEKYGVSMADMPRQVRKDFSESDRKTAEKIKQNLALNWFPDFLDILAGNIKGGSFRSQHETLTLTLPDSRFIEIAQEAGLNIFLDATMSVEELALILGCDPSEILVIEQTELEVDNLEFIQVATVGRLGVGSQRSEFCNKRLKAIIDQIQSDSEETLPVYDFKSQGKEGDGSRHWFVESRGVNDLEEAKGLIAVGTPCPNISELEARFTVLYGRTPVRGTEHIKYPIQVNGTPSQDLQPWFDMKVSADPEFRNFVRRRILEEIHQLKGRLRANRRPDEKLKIHFIADYPLDIPVTLKRASDITPEAATKTERVEIAVKAAVEQLKAKGEKITQAAIAAITGYSQQHISRVRVLLISLLDPYSKMSKTGELPPDPKDVGWVSQEYLPILAESTHDELLKGTLDLVDVYGRRGFQLMWEATPAAVQIKILEMLMLVLPASELRDLRTAVVPRVTTMTDP